MTYALKQATYEQAIDDLVQSVVITEANLALAFNHYTDDELVRHIECGKKFIRLKDGDIYRVVDIEEIKSSIAEDDDFTIKLVELSLNEPEKTKQLVNERITAIIKAEIAQIKVDYQDLLTGA